MKRRDFFKNTLVGSGLTITGILTSCSTLLKDTDRNPATAKEAAEKNIRIRYDANSKEALPHLQAYAKAVEKMKTNPQFINNNKKYANGLNWMRQAQIHLDHCPHGTWAFFPWHREYLYRFEEIIREVSQFEDFTLPYWDWSKNFSLPAFCKDDVKFKPFYLKEPSRKNDISESIKTQTNPTIVNKSLLDKDFIAFMGSENGSGELEYGPHNGVHVAVGGTMGTFKSPLDPVFWMHHCNVDRLWAIWQSKNPKWSDAEEINEKYEKWLSIPLAGFYTRQGESFEDKRFAKDVLKTTLQPLSYCYPETQAASVVRKAASVRKTQNKVRAFTKKSIKYVITPLTKANTFKFSVPQFTGNVLRYLDNYLINPHEFEKLIYRLNTKNFPKLKAGTTMKISLMLENHSDIFITNYSFFSSTKEESKIVGLEPVIGASAMAHADHHQHHESPFIPKFFFDYEKVLAELVEKGIVQHPSPADFKIEFILPQDQKSLGLSSDAFDQLEIKLVIIEEVEADGQDDRDAAEAE